MKRDRYFVGESLFTGKVSRLTENMTIDQCKNWRPTIEGQFFKNIRHVQDQPPFPK